MITVTCSCCGQRKRIDETDPDYEPWMSPVCASCRLGDLAGEARDLIRLGNAPEALELLNEHVAYGPPVSPETIIETLMYEAADYVRCGDNDEAAHRLHLAAEPKWWSEKECKEQYDAAMIETRRAREAA